MNRYGIVCDQNVGLYEVSAVTAWLIRNGNVSETCRTNLPGVRTALAGNREGGVSLK